MKLEDVLTIVYGLLLKPIGQQQRYCFRMNIKGRGKENVCT